MRLQFFTHVKPEDDPPSFQAERRRRFAQKLAVPWQSWVTNDSVFFCHPQKTMGFDTNLGMVFIPPIYGVMVDIYIYIYIFTIHGVYPLVN